MYFWNTAKLSNEIKENTLSEKDWKQYYLAVAILITVLMYLTILIERPYIEAIIVEAVLMVAIAIKGINIAFNTNKDINGSNFVARITALSFPITIKLIVLAIIIGIPLGFLQALPELSAEFHEWVSVAVSVLIQILYFRRINIHLGYINT